MPVENIVITPQQASTVYIVDSDLEVAQSIQFLLEAENIPVKVFDDGKQLTHYSLSSPPSCVITEAALTDMPGVSLLKQLRAKGIQAPVIILSNQSNVPMAVDAVKSGAWDYFEKPIIQRVLLDSVQRALRPVQ